VRYPGIANLARDGAQHFPAAFSGAEVERLRALFASRGSARLGRSSGI
jgi:hypothetical protein